jgi:SAM-dependent methyltransferase
MQQEMIDNAGNLAEAQAYYDARYSAQYADGWEPGRYVRIHDMVRSLELPARGRALDYGCGRGALTRVLKTALPGWEVVGADLSDVALEDAARHSQGVSLIHLSQLASTTACYDFVFSHHVLEHVLDLDETLHMLASLVSRGGSMLHVLPCGNAGSFEHRLAVLRRGGIDAAREGRFYCDDGPHLRRLTSEQLREALERQSFTLQKAWFGDHNWGARKAYAQKSVRDLRSLMAPRHAVDTWAAAKLIAHRAAIVLTAVACKPTYYRWRLAHNHRNGLPWRAAEVAGVACTVPLSLISTPVVRLLSWLAAREWQQRSSDPSGQEMYLYFRRSESLP